MAVELSQAPILEIAHVLFVDIVAYSTLPLDMQRRAIRNLQNAITETSEYRRFHEQDQLIILQTGDGAALVFFRDVEAPLRCSLDLAARLRREGQAPVRMGIHTGPVYRIADINANRNVAGGGINIAQRVMDIGDAGHILVTKTVAEMLADLGTWRGHLHDLGDAQVKHGARIQLFNLYTDTIGNPCIPERLSSAGIRQAAKRGLHRAAGHRRKSEWLAWILVAMMLIAAIALGAANWIGRKSPRVLRAELTPPGNVQFNFVGGDSGPIVLSPNGSGVVFSGTEEGEHYLYVWPLDSTSARRLPGTEDGKFPFWSPDSRSIGFFANGKLKRTEIAGGAPLTIGDAPDARGGTWGRTGVIVFSPTYTSGLFQVPSTGGTPTEVRKLDSTKYTTYRWPWFLPDGKHFIYLASNHNVPDGADTGIFLASLDGQENRFLFHTLSDAIYASGYLLFLQGQTLMAQAINPSSGRLEGSPTIFDDNIEFDFGVWHGVFTASENGMLIYEPSATRRVLTWFDREGRPLGTVAKPDAYQNVLLSPNEKKIAFSTRQQRTVVWTYDLEHNFRTQLTSGEEQYSDMVWSPDGSQIAYTVNPSGTTPGGIFSRASSGSGQAKLLLESKPGVTRRVSDWSPDGRYLVYVSGAPGVAYERDLWILPLDGHSKPFPYVTGAGSQTDAKFSPHGRWIAYASNETGRYQVYVAPFPWTGARWQVSTMGGGHPQWRHDGKEIFFQSLGNRQIMSAEVNGSGSFFHVGKISPLFHVRIPDSIAIPNFSPSGYAVSHDGKRFLVITSGEENSTHLKLIQNWTLQLKNR